MTFVPTHSALLTGVLLALTGPVGCWAEIDGDLRTDGDVAQELGPSSLNSDMGSGSDADSPDPSNLSPDVPWLDGTEVDSTLMADWTRAGAYRIWDHGPAPFRSTAGGGTRIYVNEILATSLASGTSTHPPGSIGIREVYYDDLMTLRGVNLTIKLEADDDSANNWLFVELFNLDPRGEPTVYERGSPVCLACHGSSPDFVRSTWPLP